MKLLLCCESYYPARGGVQEVMRQIAERMAVAGHDVSVAARKQSDRVSNVHNGVRIHEFDVSGNLVSGIRGEVERYQAFVRDFDGDAILIKAAQQWSFDALWPVLDQIKARKVFVPCGFSALYEPDFASYFAELPGILRKFDHLIFYAEKYRDIDFARAHGINSFSIVPNGASETDFDHTSDGRLRAKLGVPADDLMFLTVGTPVNAKGHMEVGEAFAAMDLNGRNATLILNGAWPKPAFPFLPRWLYNVLRSAYHVYRHPGTLKKAVALLSQNGFGSVWNLIFPKQPGLPSTKATSTSSRLTAPNTADGEKVVRKAGGRKRILCLDMPRTDVIDAFLEADLFVFASKVEYSPLVLFESAAAGLPFVTVPVGNAAEIVRWTGGGWLCPADVDEKNYVKVSPSVLAAEMEKAVRSPGLLAQLGSAGHKAWRERFTWAIIAKSYERILEGGAVTSPMVPDSETA